MDQRKVFTNLRRAISDGAKERSHRPRQNQLPKERKSQETEPNLVLHPVETPTNLKKKPTQILSKKNRKAR